MNKITIISLILITIATIAYSFYSHEVNNEQIKDIKQISREIKLNSIIIEKNTIEIKEILEKKL